MQLDLSSYAQGAALATELANTSPAVRTTGERFTRPAALAGFLAEHDVPVRRRVPSRGDLAAVLELREDVRAVLVAEEEAAVAGATRLVERAAGSPTLCRDDGGGWQWCVVTARGAALVDELAVVIGVGLLGAIRALGHERFRRCAAPDCRGSFVDVSKGGRRRYCTPELCGNRLNVAAHRARRRDTG